MGRTTKAIQNVEISIAIPGSGLGIISLHNKLCYWCSSLYEGKKAIRKSFEQRTISEQLHSPICIVSLSIASEFSHSISSSQNKLLQIQLQ